jgi:hypothetical protein
MHRRAGSTLGGRSRKTFDPRLFTTAAGDDEEVQEERQ